eukprot:TRINITY_DN21806_c0_g1_i1.p1 TRINITY_DN21806_c0_g1~~TRINITY_DN21806_c0_g1_i1.p1  ORF type:complete len:185 (+),score=43.02 TRINITY_DN21806_c0_g1_i1:147-701(+)
MLRSLVGSEMCIRDRAIARVNKLTAEGYCGMMAELHNSLGGGGGSSYDYNNSTTTSATVVVDGEDESSHSGAASDIAPATHHQHQSSSSDCGGASSSASPCYYGPYIAPGLYFHPNEFSSDGITENSTGTSISDVHQSCAPPHESSMSSVSGGGLTHADSPHHNKSHPTTPRRPAVFTHNPYLA